LILRHRFYRFEIARIWILDTGYWILDFGFWILDFGFWILDFGFWILDFKKVLFILLLVRYF
jgi:hypothetical protein